jgi:hypothetical protein
MDHFMLDAGEAAKRDSLLIVNHNNREREREREREINTITTITQLSLPAGGYQLKIRFIN